MVQYFTAEKAIEMHDWVIDNSGGLCGVYPDAHGRIQSIIDHLQNDLYYPTFEEKLTHLLYSIVMNHIFMDGNKRTSLTLCSYMLEINEYEYAVQDFMLIMEDIVVEVASNKVDRELLLCITQEIIENGELSEGTKVALIEACSDEENL